MKSIVTNAAAITILRLIDNTLKTGGGPISIGATVVQAPRGPVGKISQVNGTTWENVFGKPYPKYIADRTQMEGLRHLNDAAKQCAYVNVVRVLAQDAKFPSIEILATANRAAWTPYTPYLVNDVITIAENAVSSTGTITSDATDPSDGDSVTIGSKIYTFKTTLTPTDGEVLIGISAATALDNLRAAINHTGTPGTDYSCAEAHPTVIATTNTDTTQIVAAITKGVSGNSIVTTELSSHLAWGHATLTGGADGTVSSKLICVVAHTSADVEPTAASSDWDAFTTPIETSNQAYGTAISVATGYLCSIYPIDGDPCSNRSIKITDIDAVKQRFTLKFYDKNDLGEDYLLEYWQVGVNPIDKDDMGRSVFIETLLEERSTRFRCDWLATADWADAIGSLTLIAALTTNPAFAGGTNGGTPTAQDWIAAWDMFRNESILAYLMFAAGNTDEDVLQNCVEIAELRHTMFFFDVPCVQSQSVVMSWLSATSIDTRFAAAYHCPIAASDEWYGGKTVWGASGAAVAACAIGDANFSGDIPGVHYSPAGRIRAKLKRTKVEFLFPTDVVDRDAYYDARINPVVACDGAAIIDDALTMLHMSNYSRFIWVNRIANYIDYRFLEMASYLQHEPDGITAPGLKRGMKKILDDLVTSGALSKPRTDAAVTGIDYTVSQSKDTNPYVFIIEQPAIDEWLVTWEFCPTGSARRIVGQPILIL